MELRQLRYFLTVADERHFGRAAERLHIAQPGLSQQIRALERSVGAVLFDRESRPIALTEAGRRLLPYAHTIVEAASRAVVVTRGAPKLPGPMLKMGVTAIGDYPGFVTLVEAFSERHADVDVRILPAMPDAIVDSLIRRTLDLGVVHPPLDWPNDAEPPGYVKLGTQEVLLVIPAGHPLAAQERVERAALLDEPVIGIPQDLAPKFTKRLIRDLFGVFPHPRSMDLPEAVDRDARFRLVAEGRGITGIALPANAEFPRDRDGVVFRRVAGRPTLIEYGLAWLEVNASPSTLSFVEVARELQDLAAVT